MFRSLIICALVATATPAAARVGPEIAYTINNEIYLINPGGSGKVRIYRGKGSGFIDSVSLKKDGGAIAFVDNWVLKFMSYTATGAQSGAIYSLPGCYRQANVQYHPDGNSVIYSELCNGTTYVRQVAIPTAANPKPVPQTLFDNPAIIDLGNFDASGTSFVYSISNATAWEIRRHYLTGADEVVVGKPASGPQMRDPSISHSGTRVIAAHWHSNSGPAGTNYSSEYDVGTGTVARSNFITGQIGDYAPDDVRIAYRTTEGKTTYLQYLDNTGIPRRITSGSGFAAFNDIDWGD